MTSSQNNIPILGVDWGARRIGLSFSPDAEHVFVRETLVVASESAGIAALCDYMTKESIALVVFGLPLTLRGAKGTMAKKIEAIAQQVARKSKIRVTFFDERETSVYAERFRSTYGKDALDSVAAALVLEGFFASIKASE